MSSDPTTPPTNPQEPTEKVVIVEVSPEANTLAESTPSTDDQLTRETEALVEAIKKRAQVEAQGAGDLTRDAYLSAVRQAREALEQNKLLDPQQIEYSVWLIQKEAERNWQSILNEAATLGDRLTDAAKAAWDALTAPRSDSDKGEQL